MANVRSLRERIRSVESTRQITRSMKMVSVSKLKKTQTAMLQLTPYAEKSREMLAGLLPSVRPGESPLLNREREIRKVCYVLVTGNRGLCGVYNTALLKYAQKYIEERALPYSLLVLGRWGAERAAAAGLRVTESLPLTDIPSAEEGLALSQKLQDLYVSGEADEITFLYEHYASALSQVPEAKTLFPLQCPEEAAHCTDIIYEPDRVRVTETLLQLYTDNTVYATLLEARTGEHAARRAAMTAATDNTDRLIDELKLDLNHARQAAITTELAEIVGGSAALRDTQNNHG